MLFEKVAEPLAAIAAKEGMEYPQDLFYLWMETSDAESSARQYLRMQRG
mgnify:CR=1 FL=1